MDKINWYEREHARPEPEPVHGGEIAAQEIGLYLRENGGKDGEGDGEGEYALQVFHGDGRVRSALPMGVTSLTRDFLRNPLSVDRGARRGLNPDWQETVLCRTNIPPLPSSAVP